MGHLAAPAQQPTPRSKTSLLLTHCVLPGDCKEGDPMYRAAQSPPLPARARGSLERPAATRGLSQLRAEPEHATCTMQGEVCQHPLATAALEVCWHRWPRALVHCTQGAQSLLSGFQWHMPGRAGHIHSQGPSCTNLTPGMGEATSERDLWTHPMPSNPKKRPPAQSAQPHRESSVQSMHVVSS